MCAREKKERALKPSEKKEKPTPVAAPASQPANQQTHQQQLYSGVRKAIRIVRCENKKKEN
jgi:hypothetical protein